MLKALGVDREGSHRYMHEAERSRFVKSAANIPGVKTASSKHT